MVVDVVVRRSTIVPIAWGSVDDCHTRKGTENPRLARFTGKVSAYMAVTPQRAATIVAARCVLPRIGSPLPAVRPDDITTSDVPALIERCWQVFAALK
ncbi:MAG: hypothetical protein H0U74_02505 [Bradymonadaceae bacterium]|nr:hypothetical protein [Lujinxingiaceae bacterium]